MKRVLVISQTYILLAIALVMPLSWHSVAPLSILTVLITLAIVKFDFSSFPHKLLFLLLLCFIVMDVISLLYSHNFQEGIFVLETKLTLIIFPFIFGITNGDNKLIKERILNFFVLGCLLASLYSLFVATSKSIVFIDGQMVFNPMLEGYAQIPFGEIYKNGLSHFTYTHFSQFMHPAYFSMYCVFSILILFLKLGEKSLSFVKRMLIIIGILFFIGIIILLSSRAGLLVLFVLLLYCLWQLRLRVAKAVLFILLITLFFVLFNNSRLYKSGTTKAIITDTRFVIWKNNMPLIKENFWFGVGCGDSKDLMVKNTEGANLSTKLNFHNQYLETLLGTGIIGLTLLLSIFGYMAYIANKQKDFILMGFLLIVSVNLLFESMFNRLAGVSFFAFFTSVLMFAHTSHMVDKKSR